MRLAHHLLRHPSGVWHFRLIVPADLRPVLGLRVLKRSLGTRDPAQARLYAYQLGAQYAHAFASARGSHGMGSAYDDYLESLRGFEIKPTKSGSLSVKTDGTPDDNRAALEALRLMRARLTTPAAPVKPPAPRGPTLAQAIARYAATEAKTLKPNTWAGRQRALASFAVAIGHATPVAAITRSMVSVWATELMTTVSKITVANWVSHVAQIFHAEIRAGHIEGANVVRGVIKVKKAEKVARRSQGHGWEPFELSDLQKMFDPTNFANTRQIHVRWGALIGLYTGARVSEVAQLFLRDFVDVDGTPCMRLVNESDGQSLKTESSKRLVPIHPDLIALGLLMRVAALRAQGAERLFPDMRIDSRAGAGNSISKGFSYYFQGLSVVPRRKEGRLGFHSLRKNVIQALQGSRLPAERRMALVGHEPGDGGVHQTNYMREWTADELTEFFPGLRWGQWLDFDGLRGLLMTST